MQVKDFVEVSEKLPKTLSEISDYGDFKKITEISPTIINLCNLYLISGIKKALPIFRLFPRAFLLGKLVFLMGFILKFWFCFRILPEVA